MFKLILGDVLNHENILVSLQVRNSRLGPVLCHFSINSEVLDVSMILNTRDAKTDILMPHLANVLRYVLAVICSSAIILNLV